MTNESLKKRGVLPPLLLFLASFEASLLIQPDDRLSAHSQAQISGVKKETMSVEWGNKYLK